MRILGILLVAAGVLIFAYHGIMYETRKKVLDLGSLEITEKTEHTIPVPPVVGGIAFAAGVVVLVMAEKKR